MPRIFACLSVANALLLLATGVFGLLAARVSVDRHVLMAVLALLMSCLVQVAAFTYLTVTGKMIAQAVFLADLDRAVLVEVRRMKRRVTLWLPLVLGSLVLVTGTGAWLWRGGAEASFHYVSAGAVFVAHAWACRREYAVIVENSDLLTRVLNQYSSRQRTRGAVSTAT